MLRSSLKCLNYVRSPPDIPKNILGIQMLDEGLRRQAFGPSPPRSLFPQNIKLAQQHLADHDLLNKPTSTFPPINFPLVKLQGRSLNEHFHKLGEEQSKPYSSLAYELCHKKIPKQPSAWKLQAGWTKYTHESIEKVEYPHENAMVFDTESLYLNSPFPIMAVAVSCNAWYVWVSPYILRESNSPRHLIPLGSRQVPRLIIGHNVGYDRSMVKEEYHIQRSRNFFLDTMSLHVATSGMCSRQRPQWMSFNKKRLKLQNDALNDQLEATPTSSTAEELDEALAENPWFSRSALNNLKDTALLHCGIEMDKSDRDLMATLDRDGVVSMFQRLVTYCATDCYVTFQVFTKVYPNYKRMCPHPVSFAALGHMASAFLPIDKSWEKYLESAETRYLEAKNEIQDRLVNLAESAARLKDNPDEYKNDPFLSQLDWHITPLRYVKQKAQDQNSPPRIAKRQKLPGYPQWYKGLFSSANKPMELTVRSRIAPILLRLQWDGHPLIWNNTYGWIFRASRDELEKYTKLNYCLCDMNNEDIRFKNDADAVFFKIPHKDGHSARCTNPLAKDYIAHFESGLLSSQFDYAKQAISLNSSCSYWISSRQRIKSQMAVWNHDDVQMGMDNTDGSQLGMILPRVITMGTVTRRAVEQTWLTASNAKKSRIGSELKAMVKAPPGYCFIGADVDSEELWIASLLGDALFGLHGGTALGWMTLEGSKSAGTDLHTRTASILGISRNQAKIFNYGRIYGAGLKFAVQLLKQFNPMLSDKEAHDTASRLYTSTKGLKMRSSAFTDNEEVKPFWRGGTESVLFNTLEELALNNKPQTPVLGASITEALLKKNTTSRSNFLTSRINWSIQSSGVDYLHLLITAMDYLCRRCDIHARLAITVHDEVRYLAREEHKYKAALALQISNLWTRAMFCERVGFSDVPQSVAFFSLVDIDKVIRKEVDLDCVTPSNPTPIPPGEALDIYELLRKVPFLEDRTHGEKPVLQPASLDLKTSYSDTFPSTEYLAAQIATTTKAARAAERAERARRSVRDAYKTRYTSPWRYSDLDFPVPAWEKEEVNQIGIAY